MRPLHFNASILIIDVPYYKGTRWRFKQILRQNPANLYFDHGPGTSYPNLNGKLIPTAFDNARKWYRSVL
jgi:hypothetical protein